MMVSNARLVRKGTQPPRKERHLVINAVSTGFFISFNSNTHYTQQFITARKRSLRQCNIFTSVSHSFCPRGGGVLPSQHALGREVHFPVCIVRGKGIASQHASQFT